jgi:seryl-tRNA synthetase
LCSAARDRALLLLGNLVHESVPVDNNEDNNKIERYNTVAKREGEGLLNHVDLCYRAELSDTEKVAHRILFGSHDQSNSAQANLQGAMIGGSRCYFLKGDGVLLNQALINYGIAFLANKNYTPLQVLESAVFIPSVD